MRLTAPEEHAQASIESLSMRSVCSECSVANVTVRSREGRRSLHMKRIVLATGNAGKVREINELLAGLDIAVEPQSRFGVSEAEETGLSFVETALINARNAAPHTGLPALAGDSGLEVDALAGAPGIYSSRYAGDAATDRDNVDTLLRALADVPDDHRGARFQCVMVYLRHAADPTPVICQ